MGRLDETGKHEGYVVGYVPRDWVPRASATAIGSSRLVAVLECYGTGVPLRELGIVADDHEHDIHGIRIIGYACSCGWRSPYRELGKPFEWSPSIVHWSEWTEDLLAQTWWRPHVQSEARRTEQLNQGQSIRDSIHVALDLPRKVATDMLLFLNSLGNSDLNRVMQRPTAELNHDRADSANLGLCELGEELEMLLRADRFSNPVRIKDKE
jgi:hypothetical protein